MRCFQLTIASSATIVFVLVTVLSVDGWSVKIQRLEKGEFWVPTSVFVCIAPHGLVACFVNSQDSVLHRWCQKEKRDVTKCV